jgi:heme A synthase
MLHRLAVLLGSLVILRALHYAQRHWRGNRMAVVVYATATALLAEVLVGWLQVSLALPTALRGLHLALATAVWAGVVLMSVALRLEGAPAGPRPSPRGTHALAEAAGS